jgi:hypothetical protein
MRISDQATSVLVEQVGAVNVTWLGELADHMTGEELWGIDEALLTVLGLQCWSGRAGTGLRALIIRRSRVQIPPPPPQIPPPPPSKAQVRPGFFGTGASPARWASM